MQQEASLSSIEKLNIEGKCASESEALSLQVP
jgi:hypothetical protein